MIAGGLALPGAGAGPALGCVPRFHRGRGRSRWWSLPGLWFRSGLRCAAAPGRPPGLLGRLGGGDALDFAPGVLVHLGGTLRLRRSRGRVRSCRSCRRIAGPATPRRSGPGHRLRGPGARSRSCLVTCLGLVVGCGRAGWPVLRAESRVRVISCSPRPAWRAAAARGLRSAAGSASRARLAAQNRPALRLPSAWLATHRARWLRSRPAGRGPAGAAGAAGWGSSRAVTAAQSRAPSAADCLDELVGLAVDLGGRGQDVAAAGAEVQVVGGQVAVALIGAAEVGVQPAAGGAHVRGRAVQQAGLATVWRRRRTRSRRGRARRRPGRRVRGRRWRWPGSSRGWRLNQAVICSGSVVASRWPCRGGGGLLPDLAGEHRPAAGGDRPGPGGAWRRSWRAPGLAAGRCGVAGVAAAVGLDAELVGQGGQDAGLVFGLGGDQGGAAGGLQVQHRPQLGQRCPGRTGTGRADPSRGRGWRPGGRSRAGRPARPRPAAGRWVPAGRRPPASTTPVPVLGGNRRGPGRSGWVR